MPKKRHHHPPHIYLDNAIYFISAHTYDDLPLLTDQRKQELIDLLENLLRNFNYELITYSIVPNHYHLLFKVTQADNLPNLFQKLHGSLSFKWNKEDDQRGRKFFQNYWDYCTKDDKDFWTHFNYINLNPIKHGQVKNLEELKNYKFCGYSDSLNKNGVEWMNEILENYPIINFINSEG